MYVLKDLWHGNISPNERFIRSESKYRKISHILCEKSDLFYDQLSTEQKQQYDELKNLQFDLMNLSEEDTFIVGFRLGARMILDVIGEYKGQFRFSIEI